MGLGRRGFPRFMKKGLIGSRLVGFGLCMARLYRKQLGLGWGFSHVFGG